MFKLNYSKFVFFVDSQYRLIDCVQSTPQDQKSVMFSHSVISLNQLLHNSKNTANILLTFRNSVKVYLSQNIMHNF